MKRSTSLALFGFVFGLVTFAQVAKAQSPIIINAGFVAQYSANETNTPLNYVGMALTGLTPDTGITGTTTGPSGNLALLGNNLSGTIGYSLNFGIMTIAYTFQYSFSVNKSGQIYCNYQITQLGQYQASSVNTGRNVSMLGNTNGSVNPSTGVGPTSGPITDPTAFNPISLNTPFLFIDPNSVSPPPGYVYIGPITLFPQQAN